MYLENKTIIHLWGKEISVYDQYICITDLASCQNLQEPEYVVRKWIQNQEVKIMVNDWEYTHNHFFKETEVNISIHLNQWIVASRAQGIFIDQKKSSKIFAHKDIALAFAQWLSSELRFYLLLKYHRIKKANRNRQVFF